MRVQLEHRGNQRCSIIDYSGLRRGAGAPPLIPPLRFFYLAVPLLPQWAATQRYNLLWIERAVANSLIPH